MMRMLKKFWKSRFRKIPSRKDLVVEKLKQLVCISADKWHVSWFGRQVARFLDEHPEAVSVDGDWVALDIELTSSVPGDWGDEIFDTMYETENAMRPVYVRRRDMMTVPDDWGEPEAMRSKEHFVAIRWKLSKKMTEER